MYVCMYACITYIYIAINNSFRYWENKIND